MRYSVGLMGLMGLMGGCQGLAEQSFLPLEDMSVAANPTPKHGFHTLFETGAPAPVTHLEDHGSHDVVRFAVLGDTGKGNEGQAKVASALAWKCAQSGCDFIQLLGDNIYAERLRSADDPEFYLKFEKPYGALEGPFYVILGNHDYGANGAGFERICGQYEVAHTLLSNKWRMPYPYYAFAYRGVAFFALDTTALMYGAELGQKKDVQRWIQPSANTTWKIAFGHHPYWSNGPHGDAGAYNGLPSWVPVASGQDIKRFLEENVCGAVDLYVAAHDHSRQWLAQTCKGTSLVISGAGASPTELPGHHKTLFESNALGFLYIRIEGTTLRAEFVDAEGHTDFTHVLAKGAENSQ